MKCCNSSSSLHKEVVVIGNGPSGIALSYMLSGNIPYLTSNIHPDEFLSARLEPAVGKCLVYEDLDYLANGLEGRTTNPVSLLLDNLIHPCADIGLEIDSLVEWRNDGKKIDHVVLGKGPPGGSWHSMDPQILTLSLGTWMALPGLKYESRDGSEKRASAKNVAEYYERYVNEKQLVENFHNNIKVMSIRPYMECKGKWVEKVDNDISQKIKLCSRPEPKEKCSLTNALQYILSKRKRSRECKLMEISMDKLNNILFSNPDFNCDNFKNEQNIKPSVPNSNFNICDSNKQIKWIVEAYNVKTGEPVVYTCNHLILANGSSDQPNKLSISNYKTDPYWLTYNLKSLEMELDLHVQNNPNPDPVLIVGAGLSAADAIIATRARNIPVMHVFRNKLNNMTKQLPENMYPEYHKVHEMMKNGTNYPLYTTLPEYTLTNLDEINHTVVITSKEGKQTELKVSFVAVLIGSRPDLSFLPSGVNLARKKHVPVDCKKNTININKLSHSVSGYDHLYAVGPLAGDNFVRFIPGGALAVLSDLYRKIKF